ncbi:response regulator [Aetokthonos hydrillicola Thurmond2011]|jgi:YesN/AraC family two-component response regulator|uniref:Response regulator n=1 Tax=Aetokthonos hydrillicola Thurmond2011 TaxID=2712845 RepID=A0AAP5I908_9CYAN|nr:response regulator [Aetokthonos hydrillicola]MBO3458655.1 response regulator transcription factor [Aetokthonos hydrillicola CCALA 1050]MBW4588008.1 response regulator [Aetokthonos hydrillicola CCALA 1050]MDR9897040.1 response regulator [Aetokthonos hydrillicola Thurmond2011]
MSKILVIEDEVQSRNLFLESLSEEGFDVIGAENGLMGVQIAEKQIPDLIICDILMPHLDGYGVLSQLRQNNKTSMIPFIFLTSKASTAEIRKGMNLGADDYLTKPSTIDEVLTAIATRLEKQANLRQLLNSEYQTASESLPDQTAQQTNPVSIFPQCPKLSQVFSFVEANYHQPIGLNEVANAVGYSPAYLTDLVRRETGKSLYRWIIERRVTAAHSLLLETKQKIEHIADAVGYNDAKYFSRIFRQIYGMSPQALRNKNKLKTASTESY